MPHNVAPATEAGIEIAKEIPSGRTGMTDSGTLLPPGDLQQTGPLNGGQVYVRQAPASPQPAAVQIPQPREPSPEERRLSNAYEREQQAIHAPTTLREGFG